MNTNKEEKKHNYEITCENFSKIVHAINIVEAILEFAKEFPTEHVIFAEDCYAKKLDISSRPAPPLSTIIKEGTVGTCYRLSWYGKEKFLG